MLPPGPGDGRAPCLTVSKLHELEELWPEKGVVDVGQQNIYSLSTITVRIAQR